MVSSSTPICIHVWCLCMCASVLTHECTCGSQIHWVSSILFTLFLETSLSLNLQLSVKTGWPVSRQNLSACPFQVLRLQMCSATLSSYVGVEDLNLGPFADTESTLATELSPQFQGMRLFQYRRYLYGKENLRFFSKLFN